MTKDEALKLALEALDIVKIHFTQNRHVNEAITAIKEALAQPAPVQEPVGEVNRYGLDSHGRKWHGIYWYDPNVDVAHGTKLYTNPPAQPAPVSEPVGKYTGKTWYGLSIISLYDEIPVGTLL